MANMIPSDGPWNSGSMKAEPLVYAALSKLDDNFTIIHSLPWITAAVRSIDPSYAPTGEIDFIVLHPILGILTIEVKGGVFAYDRHRFVYVKSKQEFDPIGQVRRGTFALANLVKKAGISTKLGYAWIFPEVAMQGKAVPPALVDAKTDQRLYLDFRDTPNIGKRVIEIMQYWQKALGTRALSSSQIDLIVDAICPQEDYTPGWDDRIDVDNKTWLQLSGQQRQILQQTVEGERTIVTGRPGTGKTILAIALARIYAAQGKRVLLLFFNRPIATKIELEMIDTPNAEVSTFHALCLTAEVRMGLPKQVNKPPLWFSEWAHDSLDKAIQQKMMPQYDAVIVDEGQIFRREWYALLTRWIPRIHVFCDETQSFNREDRLTHAQVQAAIGAERIYTLTINMRSPRMIFQRLAASLPSDYQQVSVRPEETDTLEETLTMKSETELLAVVRKLHDEKINPRSICLIAPALEIAILKEDSRFGALSRLIGRFESSQKSRGLEFPIVIAYKIPIDNASEIVNAYARATTRVIAIFDERSTFNLPRDESGQHPFVAELLRSPNFKEIVSSNTNGLLRALGWELERVSVAPFEFYWNRSLCVWAIPKNVHDQINTRLWEAHLLLKARHPVIVYWNDGQRLVFEVIRQPFAQLSGEALSREVNLTDCGRCGKTALPDIEEENLQLCAHCKKGVQQLDSEMLRSIQDCRDIITTPGNYSNERKLAIGFNLIALAAFDRLDPDKKEILHRHVLPRFPGKNGYQALFALVGIELANAQPGKVITKAKLLERYCKWVAPAEVDGLSDMLKNCIGYWCNNQWLKKTAKGTYQRTSSLKTTPR